MAIQPFGTVGKTPCMGNQPIARPLHTHRATQTQNKRTQIPMPRVRFEYMTPVFKRQETIHALDRAATVTGTTNLQSDLFNVILPTQLHL
jgi:hypothetical protein